MANDCDLAHPRKIHITFAKNKQVRISSQAHETNTNKAASPNLNIANAMKHPKRRNAYIMMLSYRTLLSSSAYYAPLQRSVGKRRISSSHNNIAIGILREEPNKDAMALQMSLDSRELRFYASSSSPSQISRSRISTIQTTAAEMSSYTTTITTSVTNIRGIENKVLHSSGYPSIYSFGLAGLISSFDAEFKRAFQPYSTFSSLEEDVPRRKRGNNNSPIEIDLTPEEDELFSLLRQVTNECGMKSTLRVAGGWVRDKILASKEFSYRTAKRELLEGSAAATAAGSKVRMEGDEMDQGEMKRITSKFKGEKGEKETHVLCVFLLNVMPFVVLVIAGCCLHS